MSERTFPLYPRLVAEKGPTNAIVLSALIQLASKTDSESDSFELDNPTETLSELTGLSENAVNAVISRLITKNVFEYLTDNQSKAGSFSNNDISAPYIYAGAPVPVRSRVYIHILLEYILIQRIQSNTCNTENKEKPIHRKSMRNPSPKKTKLAETDIESEARENTGIEQNTEQNTEAKRVEISPCNTESTEIQTLSSPPFSVLKDSVCCRTQRGCLTASDGQDDPIHGSGAETPSCGGSVRVLAHGLPAESGDLLERLDPDGSLPEEVLEMAGSFIDRYKIYETDLEYRFYTLILGLYLAHIVNQKKRITLSIAKVLSFSDGVKRIIQAGMATYAEIFAFLQWYEENWGWEFACVIEGGQSLFTKWDRATKGVERKRQEDETIAKQAENKRRLGTKKFERQDISKLF